MQSKIRQLTSQQEEDLGSVNEDEIYEQVLGPEKHGRVRSYEPGYTPTSYFGTNSSRQDLIRELEKTQKESQEHKKEVEQLKAEFEAFKKHVEEMRKTFQAAITTQSDVEQTETQPFQNNEVSFVTHIMNV